MVVSVAAATCRLDKLLSGPSAATFCDGPAKLTITAAVGSETPQGATISVANCGDGSLGWKGSTQNNSPWLSIIPDTGTASSHGSDVRVQANPHGMATGTYNDVVLINGTSVTTQQAIPVQFDVVDCPRTQIVPDVVYNDTLNAADCAAPHRAGSYAQLFSFSGTANDSVSIELSADFDGYVALDTSLDSAKPPLAQADDCAGQPGNPCIPYQVIPSNGTYYVEVTSHTPADSGLFSVEVAHPRTPNPPDSLDQRLDAIRSIPIGGTIGQTNVVLRAIVSDPDLGDTLHLEAEVRAVGTNFTSANYIGAPVPNGQPATVSVTGLANHTGYHWRLRAVDQTNRATPTWTSFGNNVETTADFSIAVSQPPNAPTNLSQFQADSATSIGIGGTATSDTVVLAGQVSDPDPGDVVRLLVEVQAVGTGFTNIPTDSSAPVASGTIAKVRIGPLPNNTNYHWQAWAEDETGLLSITRISFGGNGEGATDFRIQVAHPPAVPATLGQFQTDLTPIIVGGTANQGSVVFQGTVTDVDGGTIRMEVEVEPVGTAFTNTPSGSSPAVASGQVASLSLAAPTLANGVCYHWQAHAVDNTNLQSTWTPFGANLEGANDFCVALPVSQIAFTVQPSNAMAGVAIAPPIQVTARNSLGQTVTSFIGPVTISIANNPAGGTLSGTLTQNAIAGVATFSDLKIDKVAPGYTLQAAIAGFTTTSSVFAISAGPPAQLAFVAPISNAVANQTMSSIQVAVQDNQGNTVLTASNLVTVALNTNPGGSTLGGTATVAAVNGIATFSTLTLNKTGVGYQLKATSGVLNSGLSSFFNVTGGPIASLSFLVSPSSTTAGAAITPAVQVTALDAGGNTASFNGNVTMTIGSNPTGGVLTGTLTVAASGGLAVFSDLHIAKAGVGYTLVASGGGFNVTSVAFSINAGPATQLLFTTQPTTTAAGAIIDSIGGVVVTAFDATGLNVATSFNGSVRIGITSGTGTPGAILSGTLTKSAVAGVATFSNLRIDKLGAAYQLTATSTGLSSDDSSPFDIIAGPASKLIFSVQPPAQTVAGVAMSPAVQVTAQDNLGNTATSFGGGITLTIGTNPGGGTLSGGGPITAVSGVASFPAVSIDKAANGYTLNASATGVTGATSTTFNIVTGGVSASLSTITRAPTIISASNGSSASTITVTAKDALGNPIANATVTLASTGTGNTITQPAAPTNGLGQTTGTLSSTVAETKTISATITLSPNPPVTITPTTTVVVNPATPAVLVFTKQPPATITAGVAISPAVQVEVRDSFANKVTSASNLITLTVTPSGRGTPTNNTATPSAGTATFTGMFMTQATTGANQDSLIASAAGLTLDTSTAFAVNPAAVSAAQSTVTTAQSTDSACQTSCTTLAGRASLITITAKDQFGNLVPSATVAMGSTGSNNTFTGVTNTNSSGVSTPTFNSTKAEGKTISATVGGVLVTQTAAVTVIPAGVSAASSSLTAGQSSMTACASSCTTLGGTASLITVTAKDAFNNLITGAKVVLSSTGSSNNGLASPPVTNGSGVSTATFSSTKAEGKTVSGTLQVGSGTITGITQTAAVTVNAAAASQLTFTSEPTTTNANATINPGTGIVVTAFDPFGNVATGYSASVTLSITSGTGTGGANLSGTNPVSAIGGVATFTGMSIDTSGSGYTLDASDGSLTTTSSSFDIN